MINYLKIVVIGLIMGFINYLAFNTMRSWTSDSEYFYITTNWIGGSMFIYMISLVVLNTQLDNGYAMYDKMANLNISTLNCMRIQFITNTVFAIAYFFPLYSLKYLNLMETLTSPTEVAMYLLHLSILCWVTTNWFNALSIRLSSYASLFIVALNKFLTNGSWHSDDNPNEQFSISSTPYPLIHEKYKVFIYHPMYSICMLALSLIVLYLAFEGNRRYRYRIPMGYARKMRLVPKT
jgi:hypothetical protein